MTNDEKLKAIKERIPILDPSWGSEYISMMIITSYLDAMQKEGILETAHNITSMGKNVVAVCEEFDWKPTDEHVNMFINDMVEEQDKKAFRYFITQYRDNREQFLEKIKELKNNLNNLS